jgi:hypothetical protein
MPVESRDVLITVSPQVLADFTEARDELSEVGEPDARSLNQCDAVPHLKVIPWSSEVIQDVSESSLLEDDPLELEAVWQRLRDLAAIVQADAGGYVPKTYRGLAGLERLLLSDEQWHERWELRERAVREGIWEKVHPQVKRFCEVMLAAMKEEGDWKLVLSPSPEPAREAPAAEYEGYEVGPESFPQLAGPMGPDSSVLDEYWSRLAWNRLIARADREKIPLRDLEDIPRTLQGLAELEWRVYDAETFLKLYRLRMDGAMGSVNLGNGDVILRNLLMRQLMELAMPAELLAEATQDQRQHLKPAGNVGHAPEAEGGKRVTYNMSGRAVAALDSCAALTDANDTQIRDQAVTLLADVLEAQAAGGGIWIQRRPGDERERVRVYL